MGYTRSRRYANHKSGRKYAEDGKTVLPRDEDADKAESAAIFKAVWVKAKTDETYPELKARHKEAHEGADKRLEE